MERTMSMRSYRTDGSKGNDFADLIQSFKTKHRDDASDTSSVRDRKFSSMLGGDPAEAGYYPTTGTAIRNVGDRLFLVGCGKERARQEKLREERDRQLMYEMAQMTQRPNITTRARSRPAKGSQFSEHAMLWQDKKADHRAELARKQRAELERQMRATPEINPSSVELLEQRGGHSGPVSNWEEHFARFCAKRSVPTSPSLFTPNINTNAVRIDADKTITDRLYVESSVRRERLQRMAEEASKRELIDPATGRPFFSPHALPGKSPHRRTVEELTSDLHQDTREVERKRRMMSEVHKDPELTFAPKISTTSEQLVTRIERKPLYDPKAKAQLRESQRSASADDAAAHSQQKKVANVDDFLRRTQHADMGRAQRISMIQREQTERETSECSFHPRINRKSEQIFAQTNVAGSPMQSPVAVLASPYHDVASVGSARQYTGSRGGASSSPTRGTPKSGKSAASLRGTSSAVTRSAASEFDAALAMSSGQLSPPPYAQTVASARKAPGSPMREAAGATSSGGDVEPVDHYIQAFEKQMYAVLDEWRKLEEV